MDRVKRVMWRWMPLLLWMTIIFVFSHQPSGTIPQYGPWDLLVKKGGHLVGYAILAVLARRAGLSGRVALLLAVGYAISDELHQRLVPGRTGRLLDVLIDSLGGVMGLGVYRWICHYWHGFRWDRKDEAVGRSPHDA